MRNEKSLTIRRVERNEGISQWYLLIHQRGVKHLEYVNGPSHAVHSRVLPGCRLLCALREKHVTQSPLPHQTLSLLNLFTQPRPATPGRATRGVAAHGQPQPIPTCPLAVTGRYANTLKSHVTLLNTFLYAMYHTTIHLYTPQPTSRALRHAIEYDTKCMLPITT